MKEGKKIVVIDDLLSKKAFKDEGPIGRTLKVRAGVEERPTGFVPVGLSLEQAALGLKSADD